MNKIFIIIVFLSGIQLSYSQKKSKDDSSKPLFDASTVSGLSFRSIGPALTSGRIADFAIHPTNKDIWYIAGASSGVWMTSNHGSTFTPIFDNYGSFSTSCVEIAASNPNTIWVGTGENNNQRSAAYGDGVYKSIDGGNSFENMGLQKSEHIGNIIIHPTDENTVWVAAYGPLWSSGGERGVYKTTDGGKTWTRTLFISDETGISEIAIDPTNPQILYAAAHQRRRHEWTYIGGGPESTFYKSEDGGTTWREITNGLPKGEMGRIGLAVSPVDPNIVYAIIEGKYDKGGFFRSTNKGESWSKMSGFSTSGNYYQEIICDPKDKDKVFAMDTYMHHTEDGGTTFKPTGEHQKHVDNHALWVDPDNTEHWIAGCDGGIYETYNSAKQWYYYSNLPIIQFYKVVTDNALPFYNIYGGTQDNNSMGGPSATNNVAGILNSDWFITNGGDGFESATDPLDPNTAYAQAQYGWLIRYDKKTGEKFFIQPQPGKGEDAYRWNWDAPLIVSNHDNKTLYFAANKLFKSTNKGDDWQTISPDLTRQIDRNKLEVMDQVWSIDAIMKNGSTTIYGNIVALDESPKRKGLLYIGTDDGLIQVSEDDGQNWTKYSSFTGVPEFTRVNMITASLHDESTVYAVFNNHRSGDFKPYLLKSIDKGKTWVSIASDLPQRGSVYCIKQDHIDPNLLFVGTEFGAYFSNNGGKNWIKISGLPTVAVYDLDIQKRENDLVAATFGRGFYVLDNYSPLRLLNSENLEKKGHVFPIKDALLYIQADPLGLEGTGFQGANLWSSSNPAFGATFTIYLKDQDKTLKNTRIEKEKELEKSKSDVFYPTFEDLRAEKNEDNAQLILVISDSKKNEIRRIITSPQKGIQRITWNLRSTSSNPVNIGTTSDKNNGFLVSTGKYTLDVFLVKDGKVDTISNDLDFNVKPLFEKEYNVTYANEVDVFKEDIAATAKMINNASSILQASQSRINTIIYALKEYPNTNIGNLELAREINLSLDSCGILMNGDGLKTSKEFETYPGFSQRFGLLEYSLYDNTYKVTSTQQRILEIVKEEYNLFRNQLSPLLLKINTLQEELINQGVPILEKSILKWD